MTPNRISETLAPLLAQHAYGHTCLDGRWYNPNAGRRTVCNHYTALIETQQAAEQMHARVHAAAHHTPTAETVAEGMTGLVMADLMPEDREGWTRTARMAIEALSDALDVDPYLTERAATALTRLAGGPTP